MARDRRTLIRIVVFAVIVVLGWSVVHRQILGLGATDIHDISTLPDKIGVCGRHYHRGDPPQKTSGAEIRAEFGELLPLVDPLPFPPCPAGPCTNVAQEGPCDTVVEVRVGEDDYVMYDLMGGP